MTFDIDKAKHALAILEKEKQDQQDRLEIAQSAKKIIDESNAQFSQDLSRTL